MTISNDKQVDVAFKYLELARAEILYRVKSSNDTLIVYAGAVGAIAAWAYKSYHDVEPGSLPNGPALSIPPSLLSAGFRGQTGPALSRNAPSTKLSSKYLVRLSKKPTKP